MNEILTTVAALSGISGTLALLLSVANRTIANYGEKQILINNDKEITVEGGDTLLSALTTEEIFIPSACGGKGSCGYCKVKVIEGGGEILPTEIGYVTKEEQAEGIRLSCQCKVKEDLVIEIPEELFNVKQYDYRVAFSKDVTDKIKHLRLELPEDTSINFKPGQYVQILVPEYDDQDEEIYRAYSIASSPSDEHAVELYVGYTGGIATTYVHKHLQEGDSLSVVGPFGDFFYREGDREMVLVAIGTGLAPIMSILQYMAENQIDRKATFYFGARTRPDLYEMEKLEAIKEKLPHLTYRFCLSRPTESCNWTGDVGRVTDLIEQYLEEGADKDAYLCGSPLMIDAVIPLLKEKGVPEDRIFYDSFD